MKISGKHLVEEINGVRCSVVEKDATEARAVFLEELLQYNGYKVFKQKNIPAPPKAKKAGEAEMPANTDVPETYKVGVSDLTFNVAVAVFGRKLKTFENKILLPTYWNQKDMNYEEWYWKYK